MPTTYRGRACTYTRGTLLASMGGNSFTYDADGLRLSKNGTSYTYIGGKLMQEVGTRRISFGWGSDGIMGIECNDTSYFFRKNAFGDVTHIYDESGTLHAKYVYDAWGNHQVETFTDSNIGNINPIRYRGYYYDTETGLYYLKARYYDPETGRFISQDNVSYLDPDHIMGLNLYLYCNNNPVMYTDPTGNFIITISSILIGMALGASVSLATTAYLDYKADGILFNGNNWDYLLYGVVGAITGAVGGVFSGATFATQLGVSMALGAVGNVVEGFYKGETTKVWSVETLKLAITGAVSAGIGFSITYGVASILTRIKYHSIIGGSTSNNAINKALSNAGYGNLKIGRDGLAIILDNLRKSFSIQTLEYALTALFDFVFGVQ